MMQRFFNAFKLSSAVEDLPKECYPELQEIIKSNLDPCLKGSLHATTNDLQLFLTQINLRSISDWKLSLLVNYLLFPPSYICSSFDSSLKLQLKDAYNLLYPSDMLDDINVNATFKKYRSIEYNGINYNAKKRLIVYATHLTDLRNTLSNLKKPCPLFVQYFAVHGMSSPDGSIHQHLFAVGSWLNETPHKELYGKPLELWCRDYCSIIFLPIQLIHCHAVYATVNHDSQSLYLLCPVQHISLFV